MVKQKYERIAVGVGPHNGEPEWVSGKERGRSAVWRASFPTLNKIERDHLVHLVVCMDNLH